MAAILLVRPEYLPEEMKVSGLYSGATECLGVKSFMSPLDIATVAALTPDDVEVDLWDEAVHGQINDSTPLKKYDLVGVTGFITHWRRATRLARIFRSQGIRVAAGGPGVSGAPQHYRDHFDILFIGEAEYLWPQLVADLKAGTSWRSATSAWTLDFASLSGSASRADRSAFLSPRRVHSRLRCHGS
jgi:radical SAM superfamily enzyme YgiQ (UPF0313 family)